MLNDGWLTILGKADPFPFLLHRGELRRQVGQLTLHELISPIREPVGFPVTHCNRATRRAGTARWLWFSSLSCLPPSLSILNAPLASGAVHTSLRRRLPCRQQDGRPDLRASFRPDLVV